MGSDRLQVCGVALFGAVAAACSPLAFVDDTIESGTGGEATTAQPQAGATETSTTGADEDDDDDDVGTSVGDEGPGDTTAPGETGDTRDTDGFTGDCCVPQPTPGCDDPFVSDCVCSYDAFCCEREWDELCVDIMQDTGCYFCGAWTVALINPGGQTIDTDDFSAEVDIG